VKRFLVTLAEYNRIYRVAHGALVDIGNPERACMFFAAFGALLLNRHYRIPARVVAGAFALCVGEGPTVAFFGKDEGGQIASSSDGFHMWVQTQTHVIDFMAPIYREAFAGRGIDISVPRKMLQRPISSEAQGSGGLAAPGDFITYPDVDLTSELVDRFFGRPANTDLLRIAEAWFGKRLNAQQPIFAMQDNLGELILLSLPDPIATAAW
jgi:hypothetical protein